MVTVWAPDHASRSVISSAVDIALKHNIVVTLPDGSDARIVYNRTSVDDKQQNATIYRRDLVYEVDYATVEDIPGVTITSSNISLQGGEYEPVTTPLMPPYGSPAPPITNIIS